jgi:hypothetical protein
VLAELAEASGAASPIRPRQVGGYPDWEDNRIRDLARQWARS